MDVIGMEPATIPCIVINLESTTTTTSTTTEEPITTTTTATTITEEPITTTTTTTITTEDAITTTTSITTEESITEEVTGLKIDDHSDTSKIAESAGESISVKTRTSEEGATPVKITVHDPTTTSPEKETTEVKIRIFDHSDPTAKSSTTDAKITMDESIEEASKERSQSKIRKHSFDSSVPRITPTPYFHQTTPDGSLLSPPVIDETFQPSPVAPLQSFTTPSSQTSGIQRRRSLDSRMSAMSVLSPTPVGILRCTSTGSLSDRYATIGQRPRKTLSWADKLESVHQFERQRFFAGSFN